MDPSTSIAELNLLELGTGRLGFAPNDGRPLTGAEAAPPAISERYAWVEDRTLVLYREEMDMAGQYNIEIDQGMAFSWPIWWEQETGDPVDLTGATVKMQIRKTKESTGEHVGTLASYDGQGGDPTPWFNVIDIEEDTGQISINMTGDQTEQLVAGVWFFDVVVTLQVGDQHKIIEGRATIDTTVTA
jgi:hypothetical protein